MLQFPFIEQQEKMGQQIKAVQQTVISLQGKQLISTTQAQTFLNDYHNKVENIKDINLFIENPSLKLFLKHYISNKYSSKNFSGRKKLPRQTYKHQLDSIIISEIKNKIKHLYQSYQEKAVQAVSEINEFMISRKSYLIKLSIQKILKNLLYFDNFEFICRHQDEFIQRYESSIDFLTFIPKDDDKFENYCHRLQKISGNNINVLTKDRHIEIQLHLIKWKILLQLQKNDFLIKIFKKPNQQLKQLVYETVQYLIMEILDEGIVSNQSDKIKVFASQYLKIVELSFKMNEELLKNEIGSLTNVRVEMDSTLQTIISEYFEQNSENISLQNAVKKNLFEDITKYKTKMEKQFQIFQLYRQKMDTHDFFMDFDRFGQLKFISTNAEHNTVIKIENLWGKQPIKVNNLFTEYHGLLNSIKQATKGGFKPGIVEQRHEQFSCRIYINSNSILQRIHIEIEQVYKNNSKIKGWESSYSSSDSEEEDEIKEGVTLKNIEREHPRINEEGWLNLFKKKVSNDGKQKRKTIIKEKSTFKIKTQKLVLYPIDDIEESNLNILPYNYEKINILIWQVMNSNSLFMNAMFKHGNKEKFNSFITQVKYYYDLHGNPFHNFYHGVNVMHMCYIFLQSPKIQDYLSEEDCLSIILSGLCHDVGHTGYTNSFQIATFSEKAITYNDKSPLQNYHAAKTIELLSKQKNNFLSDWDRQTFTNLKKNIIHNILSTDIKGHFTLMQKFKEWKSLPKEKALQSIQILTETIVHTSDLGGAVKDYDVSRQWSQKVNLQFLKQYEEETRLGLQKTQYMKDLHIPRVWYQNESGFMKAIVLPLYEEIHQFYDEQTTGLMLERGKNNLQTWQTRLKLQNNQ